VSVQTLQAQEVKTAKLHLYLDRQYRAVFGYKLEKADADGNNFVSCQNERMKVNFDELAEENGDCMSTQQGIIGSATGVIEDVDWGNGSVSVTLDDGTGARFSFERDKYFTQFPNSVLGRGDPVFLTLPTAGEDAEVFGIGG
jgi:hypothetical protein